MEYRRRTLSDVLNDEVIDIEKQVPRRRGTSASIDEHLDEYTEYLYSGSFNFTKSILKGVLNLICPCCYRKRETIQTN
jgi:hypothetical protein